MSDMNRRMPNAVRNHRPERLLKAGGTPIVLWRLCTYIIILRNKRTFRYAPVTVYIGADFSTFGPWRAPTEGGIL